MDVLLQTHMAPHLLQQLHQDRGALGVVSSRSVASTATAALFQAWLQQLYMLLASPVLEGQGSLQISVDLVLCQGEFVDLLLLVGGWGSWWLLVAVNGSWWLLYMLLASQALEGQWSLQIADELAMCLGV